MVRKIKFSNRSVETCTKLPQQQNQQQQDPSDNRSRQDFVMRPGTFEWLQFQRNAKTRRPSRQINIGGGFLPVSRSIVSDGAEIYFASGINNHKGVENFQRRNKEEQQRYKKREKEEKEREKRLIRNKKYDGLSKEEQDQIHHLFEGKAIQLIQQQKKNNIIDNEKKRKKSSKSNKDSESKSKTESESDAKSKSQRKLSLKQFYSKKSDIRKSSKKSSMHTSGTTVYDEEDLPFASDSESQSNSDSDGSVNSDSDGSRSGSGTGTSKSDNSKSGESDQSGPASKSVSNSSESKSNKSSGNSESASSSPSNRGSAVQAEPRSSNANEAANETDVNDTNNESGNFLNNIFGTNIFYKENIDNLDDDEPKPKAKVSNINKDDKLNDQNQQIDKFIAKLKKSQQPKSPKKTKITNDNLDELHKLKPHFKQSSSSRLPQYQKPNPHYPVSVSPNKHDVNIRSILRPPKPVRQTMSTRGPKSESISASASESILARKLSAVSLTPKPDVINRPKLSRKDEKKIIKEISGKYEIDLDQQYDNHNVNKNSPTISTKQQTGLKKTKTQIGSNVVSSPIYKSVSILSTKEERRKSIDEQHDAILQKYMGTQLKQEKIVTTEQKKKKVQDSTNTSKTIIQKTNQQEPKSDKSKKEKKSDTSASKNKSKKAKDEKSSKSKNDKIDKKLKDKNPEDIRAISPIHVISDAISSKFSDLLHNLKDNDQEQLTQRRGSSNSLSRSPKHTRSISPLRIARLDQNLLNHGYVNDTIDLNVSSKPPAQAAIHGDDGQKQNLAAESGDKDNYSNQPNIGIVSKVHDNDSKDSVENKGQYLGSENLVKSESNASEIVKVQNMVSVIDRNQNSKSSSVSPVTQTQTNTIETEYDNDDHSKSLDVISNSYGNASQSLMELNDMILRPEMQTETPILVPAEAATGPDPLNSGAKAQNQMLFYGEDKLELEVDSIDINDDSEKSGLNTETDSESEVGQTHNVEDQEKLQLFDKTITKNSTSSRVPKLDLTNVDQYASDSESDLNDNHSKVTDSNDINSKTTDSQSQTGPVLNQHETLTESSVTATECQETAQNQSNQWTDKEWREYYENIIYWQYHNTSNYNTLSKTERQKMRERLEAKRSVQQPGRSAGAGGYTLFACDTVADAMENAKSMESSSSSSSSLEALMPITMAIENLMMKSNQSNDSVQKNLDPISDSPKVYQVNKRFNMAESEQKNVNGDENLNVTKDSHDIGDISESDSVTDKIQNVDASEENNNNDTINSSIVFSEDFDLPSVPVSMSESLPVSTDTLGDAGSENGNKNNGFLNGIIGSLF